MSKTPHEGINRNYPYKGNKKEGVNGEKGI
jgi:hypothetical protein